jgi:5S rRNA maturation endonuclease (ribonuclease M5)
MTDWIAEARRIGVAEVALALGLREYRRTIGPCPACGVGQRGQRDPRLPAGMRGDGLGWACHRCKVTGDALDLVAWQLHGSKLKELDAERIKEVARWYADQGWVEVKGYTPRHPRKRPLEARPVPLLPSPSTPPPRPPKAQVEALWASCVPVCDDPEVAAWLESGGFDPTRIEDHDLARALPQSAKLPDWARIRGKKWTYGWRCLLPAWGASGELESLRARWCRPKEELDGLPKNAAAAAGPGSASGLVVAEGLGLQLLQRGAVPEWWSWAEDYEPLKVWIVEGETDFLSLATKVWSEASDTAPAILGIWAGAWTDELSARIPLDVGQIVIATDVDEAGEKYAKRIADSLVARGFSKNKLKRWRHTWETSQICET